MDVEKLVTETVDELYVGYGTDTGILLGIAPQLKHSVMAIVRHVIKRTLKEVEANQGTEYKEFYKQGLKDAVTEYAVWKDGGQYVGVMREPLRKVIERIEETGKL